MSIQEKVQKLLSEVRLPAKAKNQEGFIVEINANKIFKKENMPLDVSDLEDEIMATIKTYNNNATTTSERKGDKYYIYGFVPAAVAEYSSVRNDIISKIKKLDVWKLLMKIDSKAKISWAREMEEDKDAKKRTIGAISYKE